jgi:hypothetical protein
MPYTVQFPPKRKTAEQLSLLASNAEPESDRIVLAEICSGALEDHIRLALGPDFDPKDGQAIYYVDELPVLKTKTLEQLKAIHKVKLVFPGSKVRQ